MTEPAGTPTPRTEPEWLDNNLQPNYRTIAKYVWFKDYENLERALAQAKQENERLKNDQEFVKAIVDQKLVDARIAAESTLAAERGRVAELQKELTEAAEAIEVGVRLHRGDESSGPNAMCQCKSCTWLIKHRVRVMLSAALAQPGEGTGAARMWVRPQDMLTFKRDSDMVECRIVLAAPPAGRK